MKNVSSKKTTAVFEKIIALAGTEAELWELTPGDLRPLLQGNVPDSVLEAISQVQAGEFSFQPGYDGTYGGLRIGEKIGWFGHARAE